MNRNEVARLTTAGYSLSQIAVLLGITERSVQRHRKNAGISRRPSTPMSAEETATALALLEDGASYCEAARTIGRSFETLRLRFPGYGWDAKLGAQYRRAMQRLEAIAVVA